MNDLYDKARRVVPALWVVVVSMFVAGAGDFGTVYAADFETFDLSAALSVAGNLVVLAASVVTAVLWFGWANGVRQLVTSSGSTLRHSSAALFWWFVCPVANLFMPRQVYLELAEAVGGGPGPASDAVRGWWAPWVSYVALGYLTVPLVLIPTSELGLLVTFAAALALAIAAIRARSMMGAINSAAALPQ